MEFKNSINKKKFEDNTNEKIEKDSYSLSGDDLSILKDVDLDALQNEMIIIKKALEDDSFNFSENEKNNLRNELELISNILNTNLKSEDSVDFGKEIDEKIDYNNLVMGDEDSNSSDNLLLDENEQGLNVDSSTGLLDEDDIVDNVGNDLNLDEDDIVDNFSVDNLLLDENEQGLNVDSDAGLDEDDIVDNVGNDLNLDEAMILENNEINKNVESDEDIDSDITVDDALNNLVDDYSDEISIKVDNVSMDFKVSKDKIDTLKEFFIRTVKRNKSKVKTVHALKNISFEITKGDRVGIIGFNGAGKSTLLKLLSSVYYPTEGTIETKGKIAPLLELGAGFDNNYTGKDNIFLNGAFLGYSEDFLKEKYDEIVEFSELGEAINYHVKTYSSGMRAKLGFSIATIVEPDILILDEILSVGDIRFRRKSADKIKSLINSGITVLLVSHTVGQIRELCNKAIWIDNGELKMMGDVNEVCDEYVKASTQASSEQLENLEFT